MAALNSQRRPSRRRRQRGVALMIAIFAMVVISLLGLAVLTVSTNGSRFSQQASGLQSATNAAQAGAEEARALLRDRKGAPSPVLAMLCPPAVVAPPAAQVCSTSTVIYVLNYNGTPWLATDKYADPTFVTEPDPFNGGTVATGFVVPTGTQIINSTLANAPGFKWARINVATENSLGQVVDSGTPSLAAAMLVYDASPTSNGTIPGRYPCGPVARTVAAACTGSALGSGSTNPQPVFQITSYAVVNGYTRVITEQVSRFPFSLVPPAPVTLTGTSPVYSGPNSNNFTISGVDASGVYPTLPAMGGTSNAAASTINSGIPSVRDDCSHYGPCPSGSSSTTPVITNVSGTQTSGCTSATSCNPLPLSQSWNTEGTLTPPSGLLGLYSQILASADVVCSASPTTGVATCPSSAGDGTGFLDSNNPGVTVIEGPYTLPNNFSGGGTLVVTGDLTIDPNITWNGLILLIGTGRTLAGGNGTPTINGAVFAANVCGNYGMTDPTGTPADLSGQNEGQTACNTIGNADFHIATGGGNSGGGIRFNSSNLTSSSYNRNFAILSYRERSCAPATGGAGACTLQDYIN